MKQIKLGIIGTGLAAEILHWPALKKLHDRIQISAVCNRTLEKAVRFAKLVGCQTWYSDYNEMLAKEDLDAVLVCTPIYLNYPITEACVKAGKHVLCEKPPGVNLEEAQKMVALSQNADQIILIGENYYYRDDLNKAQELVEAGKIGNLFLIRIETILSVDAHASWTSRKWRIEPSHRGGIVTDAGVHHMAAFRLFGGEVLEVSGYELDVYPEVKDSDNLLLNLKFNNHIIGQYTATYTAVAQNTIPFRMEIYGNQGSIFITDGRVEIFSDEKKTSKIINFEDFDLGFTNQWMNFCDAIQKGVRVLSTPERTYKDFELVMKGIESAENGEVIKLLPCKKTLHI